MLISIYYTIPHTTPYHNNALVLVRCIASALNSNGGSSLSSCLFFFFFSMLYTAYVR